MDLLDTVQALATQARGRYTPGGQSAVGYDCSGLVWVGLDKCGLWHGPRLTTENFGASVAAQAEIITDPGRVTRNCVAVWTGHLIEHMGVCRDANEMYAARSIATGIGWQNISGITATPTFYQFRS